jgi:protein-arginine kinase activator protein McsA
MMCEACEQEHADVHTRYDADENDQEYHVCSKCNLEMTIRAYVLAHNEMPLGTFVPLITIQTHTDESIYLTEITRAKKSHSPSFN